MRISVTGNEIETVIVTRGEGCLQPMVSRPINVREVVDEAEIGVLGGKRLHACCKVRLIAINDAGKFHGMVANVGDVETELAGESMLDSESPVLYVGSAEIAIHSEGVAWTGIRRAA